MDLEYDFRVAVGEMTASGSFEQSDIVGKLPPASHSYFAANNEQMPDDPVKLTPFVTAPEEQAALQKAIKQFEAMSPEQRVEGLDFMLKLLRPK